MLKGLEHTQKKTAEQLEKLLASGNFPYCSLFSGSRYTGRMYAAVEVAAVLGAGTDSTLILSERDSRTDIRACLNLFRKQRNSSSANLLKRTVLTFLMQFHGALLDSASQTNKKKFSDAGETRDLLTGIYSLDEDSIPKWADSLEKSLEKLYAPANTQIVTIGKIRDIRRWCSEYSADGKSKVIIIEGIENCGDSVSNALLKILEEPPEATYFILISRNPGRIGQTVLSRVRHFVFSDLDEEGRKYIFNSLYLDPSSFPDLRSFFLSMSGTDDRLLLENASRLSHGKGVDMSALTAELEKNRTWTRFYELLIGEIRKRYEEGEIDFGTCSALVRQTERAVSLGTSFNQNSRMTFESVVFRTLEVLH